MRSLQWLFREILAIIHENGDSDATRARNLVKRFHDRAPHPAPLASSAEASFQSTTDLANRTESGVAAMPVLT